MHCLPTTATAVLPAYQTWNHFHMRSNETIFLQTAASFNRLGLRGAGYTFLNTDDGWLSPNRSATGELVPMPDQFPSGIPALTKQLHAMGFHFGICPRTISYIFPGCQSAAFCCPELVLCA